MITLNNEQQVASDFVVKTILETDKRGCTILGEGGTGKTTSIMHAVARLQRAGLNVLLTAPTNKATNQLKASADNYGVIANQYTLAKALGLALLPDRENKKAHKLGRGCIDEGSVLIADEGSMISSTALYSYLIPALEETNSKVIFMGDKFQLPPVKEFYSPALGIFESVELTKVERQQGDSPILKLCRELRTSMINKTSFKCESVGVDTVKAAFFTDFIIEQFSSPEDTKGKRALAWTNARVEDINMLVRKKLYGRNVPPFVAGERVSTGSPVIDNSIVLMPTDIECVVTHVSDSNIEYTYNGITEYWRCNMVGLQPDDNFYPTTIVNVPHESESSRFSEKLSSLAERAKKSSPREAYKLWKEYHHFKDFFQTLKHCYAITVHRSQGSTYEQAFVDVIDLLRCKQQTMRQQLAYVACSRPKTKLVLNRSRFEL